MSQQNNSLRGHHLAIEVGKSAFVIYLIYILSSFFWQDDWWLKDFLHKHYVFLVGVPFAGIMAYTIVGTLESTRGNIEFEALGLKFKGASGPILMWVIVFLSIVLAIRLVWPLS